MVSVTFQIDNDDIVFLKLCTLVHWVFYLKRLQKIIFLLTGIIYKGKGPICGFFKIYAEVYFKSYMTHFISLDMSNNALE